MDLWSITIKPSTNTNCTVPQQLLNSDQITLPLVFKITNPATKHHIISVADDFFETDTNTIKLPPMLINRLALTDSAYVELINHKPELIPPKAKMVILEPRHELFYKLKNPQKILEKYLKNSYIIGVDYMIPLELKIKLKNQIKIKVINIRIAKLLDQSDQSVPFANINNLDLNVDFLPIPEHLQTKKKKNMTKTVAVAPIQTTVVAPIQTTVPIDLPVKDPLFDSQKHWVPFCGWGRTLSSGKYVEGTPQTPVNKRNTNFSNSSEINI